MLSRNQLKMVNDLEDMMSEWMINPGDIGYAFATGDEQPLPDDESGLPRKYKHAVGYQLLLRMLSDYSLNQLRKFSVTPNAHMMP